MIILEVSSYKELFDSLSKLSYPWCNKNDILKSDLLKFLFKMNGFSTFINY
jgi:hypothetical protein